MLQITTKNNANGKRRHDHIIYVPNIEPMQVGPDEPDTQRVTFSSMSSGHRHEFVVELINQQMPDGTNMLVPGNMEILEAEGHVHELLGDIPVQDDPRENEDEVLKNVYELRKRAVENDSKTYSQMRENEKFLMGDQWPQTNSSKEGLTPKITFNHTLAMMNVLSGFQRNNRTEPKCFPVSDGSEIMANVYDVLLNNVLDYNNFHQEETLTFEDQAGLGFGVFRTYFGVNSDLMPEIIIINNDWEKVHFGPHSRIDQEDMDYLTLEEWLTKREIENMYPEKKKDIKNMYDTLESGNEMGEFNGTVIKLKKYPMLQSMTAKNSQYPDLEIVELTTKNIKLIETWIKESIIRYDVINVEDGYKASVKGVAKKWLNQLKTIPDLIVSKSVDHRMRKVVWAGTVILEDEYPEVPYNDFPIVTAYAHKKRDKCFGKVEQIKDLNRYYNKTASQTLAAMSKMVNYGWFVDQEMFANPEEKANFKRNSSTPGFVSEVMSVDRVPVKMDDNKFPFELVNTKKDTMIEMREITNINSELMASSMGSTESNVMMQNRIKQSIAGNEYLFDNLEMAKKRLYKIIMALISYLYDEDDIIRIIKGQAMSKEITIAGEKINKENPLSPELEAAIRQIIQDENHNPCKYDIVVSEKPDDPTVRTATFNSLSQMMMNGAIGPEWLPIIVKLAPGIPKDLKQEALEIAQQSMQMQQQKDTLPYETEIYKADKAAESKEEKVTQRTPAEVKREK